MKWQLLSCDNAYLFRMQPPRKTKKTLCTLFISMDRRTLGHHSHEFLTKSTLSGRPHFRHIPSQLISMCHQSLGDPSFSDRELFSWNLSCDGHCVLRMRVFWIHVVLSFQLPPTKALLFRRFLPYTRIPHYLKCLSVFSIEDTKIQSRPRPLQNARLKKRSSGDSVCVYRLLDSLTNFKI